MWQCLRQSLDAQIALDNLQFAIRQSEIPQIAWIPRLPGFPDCLDSQIAWIPRLPGFPDCLEHIHHEVTCSTTPA